MAELERRGVYPVDLQTRQLDGRRILSGLFPFNQAAIVSDRGRRRKELFRSDANGSPFTWQLAGVCPVAAAVIRPAKRIGPGRDSGGAGRPAGRPGDAATGDAGHRRSAGRTGVAQRGPAEQATALTSRWRQLIAGSLELTDGPDGLRFEATLPHLTGSNRRGWWTRFAPWTVGWRVA